MSTVLLLYNIASAQTYDMITRQKELSKNNPQMQLGTTILARQSVGHHDIEANSTTNKIYVSSMESNTISVIDSNTGNVTHITVGTSPQGIAINPYTNILYVVNSGSKNVTVIDGSNNKKLYNLPVQGYPTGIAINPQTDKIYVTNSGSGTVSVIDAYHNNKEYNVPVRNYPTRIAVFPSLKGKIYVINSNSVSVINGSTDKKESNDISVGKGLTGIAINPNTNKIYVTNTISNRVYVINGSTDTIVKKIPVGKGPTGISINSGMNIIYVVNSGSNTVSVIDGSTDKLTAGVTFDIHPANSGSIWCDNKDYPTNIHLYIASDTKCVAKPNKDFEFVNWVENLVHNSSVPLNQSAISDSPLNSFLGALGMKPNDSSATFDVNRFGIFTANFKPLPPPVPPEYWASLFTVVATALIGSLLIPAILGWFKSKRQISRLNSFYRKIHLHGDGNIDQLNTSHNQIINAYSEGKISNEQYATLKTELSILYETIFEIRIDSSDGTGTLLNEVKEDVIDAYAKEKISEKHYNLLIEKISGNKKDQGSADKLSSSQVSEPTTQGSPIKS